jgi:prevent-host-death family protein
MPIFGMVETRRRFSELVRRASRGERIGISRRGKLVAILEAADHRITVKRVFADIERIRKRGKPLPKGVTIKDLIEEGRN